MKNSIILCVVVLFFSCKQNPPIQEPKSYFCSPQLEEFFSGADSLPVIEFKHTDSFAFIKEQLTQVIDTNTTLHDYFVSFKIKYTFDSALSPVYLKVFIENPFPAFLPPYCGHRNRIDIRINSNDQYLVEGEYGDSVAIQKMIFKDMTNYGKDPEYSDSPLKATTSIKWDYGTSKRAFDNTIKAIISGYTEVLNTVALRKYNKEFCSLTSQECDSITTNYGFNLQLGYVAIIPMKIPLPLE
jgi:hypothetical protein